MKAEEPRGKLRRREVSRAEARRSAASHFEYGNGGDGNRLWHDRRIIIQRGDRGLRRARTHLLDDDDEDKGL